MNSKKTIFKVAIALIVIAGLVGGYFAFMGKTDEPVRASSDLTISGSPKEFNLSVNGEDYGQVKAGETITVNASGQVELVASREGFADVRIPWQLSSGKANGVNLNLEAVSAEAKALLAEELGLQNEFEVGQGLQQDAEEAYKNYPILSDMPHKGNRFELYQGLPKQKGYEFGIYLQIFEGAEDEGRTAFKAWMEDHGYDPDGYNVIEEKKPARPSTNLPEPPTSDALNEITVDSIKATDKPTLENRTADQLAQYFGLYLTTWEPKKDGYVEYSEFKAKPLMSSKLAKTIEEPYRPTITYNWQVAQSNNARSHSWIQNYESTTKKGVTTANMEVCWAWVSGSDDLRFDAPRELEVSVKDGKVEDYTYTDPDPFVDSSGTVCDPKNR
ncbi:hypothetical protein [Glutamicibacter ardleyensis]|uniref:hypothetical protein n=1 Tax=Glutamicibacter ardleyensis TaxID=225894 RepID=UPI003FCFE5B3